MPDPRCLFKDGRPEAFSGPDHPPARRLGTSSSVLLVTSHPGVSLLTPVHSSTLCTTCQANSHMQRHRGGLAFVTSVPAAVISRAAARRAQSGE